MKTRLTVLFLAAACCFAWADDRSAAVVPTPQVPATDADAITIPKVISYQGKLTDNLGNPVIDSSYSVTFRLYTVPSGGSAFWNETQIIWTLSGLFSCLLGSTTPIGYVPDAGNLYLEMQVNPNPAMTPRVRIVSAAYAYKADSAGYASAAVPAGTAAGDLAGTYPGPTVDGLQGRGVASTAPSVDQVLKWSGSAWTPSADNAGGPPSGPAGGDLTGTYPNPTIAANAVGSAEVIDASLRGADFALPCTLSGDAGADYCLLRVTATDDGGIQVDRTSTRPTNGAIVGKTTSGSGSGVIGKATGDDGASVGVWGQTTPGTRPGVYGVNSTTTFLAPNVAAGVAGYSASGPAFFTSKPAQACYKADSSGTGYTAFYVAGADYNAYAVESAGYDGFWVTKAANRGVYVGNSGTYGAYVNSNDARGGYFRNNNNTYYALTAWNNTGTGGTVRGMYVQGHGYATGGWLTYLDGGGSGCGVVSPDMEIMVSGTGRLSGGRASVPLEKTFRDAVSADVPLKVIVTPNQMCNGICVTERSAGGFSVTELADGTSDAGFDWIAIGRLKGYEQRPEVRVNPAEMQAQEEQRQREDAKTGAEKRKEEAGTGRSASGSPQSGPAVTPTGR